MTKFIKILCISLLFSGITANAMNDEQRIQLGWQLIDAAEDGNYENAKQLIAEGAHVNQADEYGNTPLIMASEYGHLGVVQLLLEQGALVNLANDTGYTPLIWASVGRYTQIVHLLLERKAQVDQANFHGGTPLMCAAIQGIPEAVQLLLNYKAQVNMADNDGTTPLLNAIQKGHSIVVKLLLEHGADVKQSNNYGMTPLRMAARSRQEEICEILVEWMLSHCPTNSQKQRCKTLLLCLQRLGIPGDIRKSVFPPLLLALAAQENKEKPEESIACQQIIKITKKITKENTKQRLLEKYCKKKMDEERRAQLGRQLIEAVRKGNYEKVEQLINAGADVNQADCWNCTPLLLAAGKGHEAVVQALIRAHANVNQENEHGVTPLISAAAWGREAAVQALIVAHADVNQADRSGDTPLILAASKGHEAVAELLIEWMLSHCPNDSQKQRFKTLLLCLQRFGVSSDIRKSVFPPLLFALAAQENKEKPEESIACQQIIKITNGEIRQQLLDKFFNNPSSPKGYFGLENNHE